MSPATAHIVQQSLYWAGWIAFAAFVLWLLYRNGAKVSGFFGETVAELKKCTWPWNPAESDFRKKYKELIDSTLVVAVFSILLAAFITSSDFLLVQVIGFFTR
ncbi:preprotein translocase subunit SecE [Verrucomicrobium sp. GAS474]|uniref:preprotein translocase subunit SecE n=1 Tax=Verrucomicrobium sp. GAS474 TaxID=1882831 RepID=UPI00087AB61A|nr:preprotein translocase subunit SecE [Verrucomicrobium sp. GAS474]SDT86344.1 preprotein translocase subunit SecE [Verrucomicrobium sp. GAS474]